MVVTDPSRTQRIRAVETLPCGVELSNDDQPRSAIEELCRRWDPGSGSGYGDILIVTVLVRRGLCVWTPVESAWRLVWRYAFTPGILRGGLITVTEHGWHDMFTGHADHRPRMRSTAA